MSLDERTAVVQLSASEARDAHIAASKRGMDRDSDPMAELRRAFGDDDDDDYPSGEMRFMASAAGLSEVAMKAQSHGKERRERGHLSAQSKYYSIGDKLESQLVRQGAWMEDGV